MVFPVRRLALLTTACVLSGATHTSPLEQLQNTHVNSRSNNGQPSAPTVSAQTCKRAAPRAWQRDQEWTVPNTTPPCVLRVEATDIALTPDGDKVGFIRNIVAKDAAGKYYTNDRDGTLALWSPTGKLERMLARSGQGPGEIAPGLTNIVTSRTDQVYVLDNNGRWHLFRTNGDFVQTVQSSGVRQRHNFAVLDDGRLLDGSGRDDSGSFFVVWSPLGDPNNPRPVIARRFAPLSESERAMSDGDRSRAVAYGSGDSFWAGPPKAAGRGYQLEQWSTTGTRLKSLRRTVPWFPAGSDRAKPRVDGPQAPAHTIRYVWNLGDDLLLAVTDVPNTAEWSKVRAWPIDGKTRDKLNIIRADVIDTRSGQLLAQLGPLTQLESLRQLPSHVFQGSMTGYQFQTTPDDDISVRMVRLRLEAK